MKKFLVSLALSLACSSLAAASSEAVKGFNLTEIGEHVYDASLDLSKKTDAQKVVDRLYDLGIQQINLNPRAMMRDPRGVELIPMAAPGRARGEERNRYLRLIKYIKSKGMKVGIRPIFFVVDDQGRTPMREVQPDGSVKVWWHGNVQPGDPYKWFDSYKNYLDIYLAIAKVAKVDEFTIGAELYSMTVGIEDQWLEHPHGFGPQWLDILRHTRNAVGKDCRIMYDINFTDERIIVENTERHGGEFARWKYRLVDLQDESNPHWQSLRDFWLGLDAIGIDMYRSLASSRQVIPQNYDGVVSLLKDTSDRYAGQIDNVLFDISAALGAEKPVMLKELGFRSVTNGFINPFEYANAQDGVFNSEHQAAAYDAIFQSFYHPGWSWFAGAVFWDTSVNMQLHGDGDKGFSPIGKKATEEVFLKN